MRNMNTSQSVNANLAAHEAGRRIGAAIRAARKALRVSAITAAEAAGISRVTLHRIERGDTTVNMGAYLRAAEALGVSLGAAVRDAHECEPEPGVIALTDPVIVDQYPQLKMIAWSIPNAGVITPQIALGLYERNWRYVDQAAMQPSERALLNQLVKEYGNGCLFV